MPVLRHFPHPASDSRMPSHQFHTGNLILWFRESNPIVLPTAELSPAATAAVLMLDKAIAIWQITIVRSK